MHEPRGQSWAAQAGRLTIRRVHNELKKQQVKTAGSYLSSSQSVYLNWANLKWKQSLILRATPIEAFWRTASIKCCISQRLGFWMLRPLSPMQKQHIMDVPSGIVVYCLKWSILWFAIMRELTIYISHETPLQLFTLYPQGVVCFHLVGEYVPNFSQDSGF